MTKKTAEAAKRAAAAAKRVQANLEDIAKRQNDEAARKLVAQAFIDAKDAEAAAAEIEAEAQRQIALHEKLEKENPTLWQQVKAWF